ncbi:MAG TPA: DUF4124 domain-containing protein [Casimicrobiaceae bacterium]|nr:DUF4124 domain-containing protein [Casimicrobiaceae bacterium]
MFTAHGAPGASAPFRARHGAAPGTLPGGAARAFRRGIPLARLARVGGRLASLVAAASILATPVAAWAGLYKCALDNGGVTYQQAPCPAGKELRDFDRDPANVSVLPFTSPPRTDSGRATARADRTAARDTAERKPRKKAERKGNAAERRFLFPGIGEGEVVARVGRPDISTGGGRKTTRWTYLPAPDDPATITTLTFQFGRLIEVERKLVPAQ